MGFFDSISQALGTDGGNSGLLPSVSNALGTDGSKNGLLNDPLSMAAAAATAAYFTGGFSLAVDGASAGAVSDGAAIMDASTAAASTTTAANAATAATSWNIPWSSIGSTAADVGKAVLPLYLRGGAGQPTTAQRTQNAALMPSYGVVHDNVAASPMGANANYAGGLAAPQNTTLLWAAVAIFGLVAFHNKG